MVLILEANALLRLGGSSPIYIYLAYEPMTAGVLAMLCREELQVFVDVVITVNAANSWFQATSAPSAASPIF